MADTGYRMTDDDMTLAAPEWGALVAAFTRTGWIPFQVRRPVWLSCHRARGLEPAQFTRRGRGVVT